MRTPWQTSSALRAVQNLSFVEPNNLPILQANLKQAAACLGESPRAETPEDRASTVLVGSPSAGPEDSQRPGAGVAPRGHRAFPPAWGDPNVDFDFGSARSRRFLGCIYVKRTDCLLAFPSFGKDIWAPG